MRQLSLALISILFASPLLGDSIFGLMAQSRRVTSNLSNAVSETKRPIEDLVAILEADAKDLAEVELAMAELKTGTKEALESATGRVAGIKSRAIREQLSSLSALIEAVKLLEAASESYPMIDGEKLRDELHHLALHPVRDVMRQHLAAADAIREGLARSIGAMQKNATLLEEAMTRGLLERQPEVAR